MKIYVIQGSSGEYDTFCEWIVSLHITEKSVVKKLDKLNKFVEDTKKIRFATYNDKFNYLKEVSPDSYIQWQDDGVDYAVLEFEVEDE